MTDDMTDERIAELIIGDSVEIRRVRAAVARVAPTNLSVVIQGPTGSGKELVARALHLASGRPGRLVAFNVCAIAESMFEDALFGHVRGAFTGAVRDTRGYLREADRGTAFFDEIGGLALAAQATLLRAVELGEFRPVGAAADVRSDFRVVVATNESLGTLVDAGRFRADLAHRLGGVVIDVPALAARLEDVPLLARHFIRCAGAARGVRYELTDGAARLLQRYEWSGNVRELRQVIERALAFATTSLIDRHDVETVLSPGTRPAPARHDDLLMKRRLLEALESVGWDTARAAQCFGAHRATIYRWMKRLGIKAPPHRATASAAGADADSRPFARIRANPHAPAANPCESLDGQRSQAG